MICLREFLEKDPDIVTKYSLKNNYEIELLTFHDRPFKSVTSIISKHITQRKRPQNQRTQ